MSNSSIWPIDRTLSGATIPGQNGPGSECNEGVLSISQSSSQLGQCKKGRKLQIYFYFKVFYLKAISMVFSRESIYNPKKKNKKTMNKEKTGHYQNNLSKIRIKKIETF